MKNTNMATLIRGLFCTVVLFLAAANCALALKHFKVGGRGGWHEPAENETSLYSDWATRKRFHVGDSLVFVYKNDSVLVVDKWSYYHCKKTDPIMAFDTGNSTFTLNRPGPFYFISGTLNHCENGQRLLVNVMHPHHHHNRGGAGSPNISPASSPRKSDSISLASSVEMAPMVMAFTMAVLMASCF